jgi:signal transduction histidine kinase
MKNLFQSMTTRVFLMLFVGVLLSAAVSFGLALGERQRLIGQFRDFHAVERVAQFVLSLETVPAHLREPFFSAAAGVGMRAQFASPSEPVTEPRSQLASLLDQRLPDSYRIVSTSANPTDCAPAPQAPRRGGPEGRGRCEALLVTLNDGTRLHISVLPPRPPPFFPRFDVPTYGSLFILGVGLVAAFVARMAMRPLKQLAQAATDLGNNIEREPLPVRGARELRQAAAAFNLMQSRIRSHIRQRAHILAAITHDLQTPLTRLRLRLEKVDDTELRDKLVNDLSAMQAMVREGLDLARSMDSAEGMQRMDLDSLVDSVCSDAVDAGQPVSFSGATHTSLMARPIALRRCLTNLIDNAVKYGHEADVHVAYDDGFSLIQIRDKGPGIPAAEKEKVFEPFYRLEDSRSRETGGTGIGLTIAKNIAEQHGGTLTLGNLRTGGLEVVLRLPAQRPQRA